MPGQVGAVGKKALWGHEKSTQSAWNPFEPALPGVLWQLNGWLGEGWHVWSGLYSILALLVLPSGISRLVSLGFGFCARFSWGYGLGLRG